METEREVKDHKYEDYIADVSPGAAAVGRREPYHLIYLKKYGEDTRAGKKGSGTENTVDRGDVRAEPDHQGINL